MVKKIISGGQRGADRAGLDVGRELGLELGGWCPKGRRAFGGPIPAFYPLKETDSAEYPLRTRLNIRDSDGTIVLVTLGIGAGSKLTINHAKKIHKPLLVVVLDHTMDVDGAREWLQNISVLNVAGSSSEWIYQKAVAFLRKVLSP